MCWNSIKEFIIPPGLEKGLEEAKKLLDAFSILNLHALR